MSETSQPMPKAPTLSNQPHKGVSAPQTNHPTRGWHVEFCRGVPVLAVTSAQPTGLRGLGSPPCPWTGWSGKPRLRGGQPNRKVYSENEQQTETPLSTKVFLAPRKSQRDTRLCSPRCHVALEADSTLVLLPSTGAFPSPLPGNQWLPFKQPREGGT